jgi:zinc D-Ala-D-Ala carboxypeptidase
MANNISKHITYAEATKSATALKFGIDNNPNAEQLENMEYLAEKVLEPLREGLGNRPINHSCFFRCDAVNKLTPGASKTSQHPHGEADDIDNDGVTGGPTNLEIFHYIREHLEFDQLIAEHPKDGKPSWVHVSIKRKGTNRKEILVAKYFNGKTVYQKYTGTL